VKGRIYARRSTPSAGDTATVVVPVATMWSGPEAVRDVDAPAVADLPDVRRWVTSMSKQQLLDLGSRTLTQLLLGERVLVEEVSGDWARVVAVEQPAGKLDARGYPGVVRTAHLTVGEPAQGVREVVVDATATALCDEPNGDVLLSGVVIGTRLAVAGHRDRGWLPVHLPAADGPVWVREADVAAAGTGEPSAKELLAVAERLRDVPYVWGGLSAYGIDCSGLVHLAHRRLGVTVPRDADDQSLVGEQVELGHEQPGDLYFFARDGKPPHHVGLVAGADRQMLHASGQEAAGRVVNEPMTDDRSATLVAARRTLG